MKNKIRKILGTSLGLIVIGTSLLMYGKKGTTTYEQSKFSLNNSFVKVKYVENCFDTFTNDENRLFLSFNDTCYIMKDKLGENLLDWKNLNLKKQENKLEEITIKIGKEEKKYVFLEGKDSTNIEFVTNTALFKKGNKIYNLVLDSIGLELKKSYFDKNSRYFSSIEKLVEKQ
jgi:hypothetical protein